MTTTYDSYVRPYIAPRTPMYAPDRRIDAVISFTDRSTLEIQLHHDDVLALLADLMDKDTGRLPLEGTATMVAIDLVLSDRDTGSSLHAWTSPLRLVEMLVSRALGGDVVSVTLDFPAF